MGIFGDDKLQDQRIAALESHVRSLTNQLFHADGTPVQEVEEIRERHQVPSAAPAEA